MSQNEKTALEKLRYHAETVCMIGTAGIVVYSGVTYAHELALYIRDKRAAKKQK